MRIKYHIRNFNSKAKMLTSQVRLMVKRREWVDIRELALGFAKREAVWCGYCGEWYANEIRGNFSYCYGPQDKPACWPCGAAADYCYELPGQSMQNWACACGVKYSGRQTYCPTCDR